MNKHIAIGSASAGLMLLAACGQQETMNSPAMAMEAPPPVIEMKDFFRNPEKSGFQISPDGNYFAFRAPWKSRMNLFVQKVGDSTATQVTTDTVRDVSSYFWKNDRLIYSRDINGDENFIVFSASTDGKDVKALTPEKGVRAGVQDDLRGLAGRENTVLLVMNKRNPEVFDPWYVDIATGSMTQALDNTPNYENYVTDHNGVIRFASKTDGVNTNWFYRASEKEPFAEYMTVSFKDSWNPMFFTFDNVNCYVNSNLNGRDKTASAEWDIAGKKEVKEVYSNKDYDDGGLSFSRKRKVLTTAGYQGEKEEMVFLDDETKKMYERLRSQFPGMEVRVASESDDETKRTVWVGSDKVTGRFYYDADGQEKATLLCDRTPWLKEDQMADMTPITFQSRDGLTIHGYLTLPKGREAKNLPVVINPHGGPWARDGWGFDPEVQFMANRGFAVLQPNFRGSTGYGAQHLRASHKQWGGTMIDDMLDGVQWAIDQGYADKDRLGVYGASYGGYSTLMAMVKRPDWFKWGINYVGVTDMFVHQDTQPAQMRGDFAELAKALNGDQRADRAMFETTSPTRQIARITAPVFHAYGGEDRNVDIANGNAIRAAFDKAGKPYEWMFVGDEVHGYRQDKNAFEFYNRFDRFIAAHTPPAR